jgi:diguanylate cyclase (GGDEF)-like protein
MLNKHIHLILPLTALFIIAIFHISNKYAPKNVHALISLIITSFFIVTSYIYGRILQELYERAYTDSLTGLKNRGYLYRQLTYELKNVRKMNADISLAIIDIDDFKTANDRCGHLAGDKLMVEMAGILQNNVRDTDTVIRWGGDEFVIILPGTSIRGAYELTERIRSIVENRRLMNNVTCSVTISVGLASIDKNIDINRFIDFADIALYKAKQKKNYVATYEPYKVG